MTILSLLMKFNESRIYFLYYDLSLTEIENPDDSFLLGSAGPDLLKNTSESLAGRVYYRELFPFNVKEVHNDERLWFRGGFPEAYSC